MVGRFNYDPDMFGYLDIEDEVEKLGYVSWKRLWYKVSRKEVYKDVSDDKDVLEMLSQLKFKSRFLYIYVDGGKRTGEGKEGDVGQYEGEGGDGDQDEGEGGDASQDEGEEDFNYIPSAGEKYSDDELDGMNLLPKDDEYLVARQRLRDGLEKGICDTIWEEVGMSVDFQITKILRWMFIHLQLMRIMRLQESEIDIGELFMILKCDHKKLLVSVGMRFVDGLQAKDALTTNAIENGWQIHFKRAKKEQVEAACIDTCNWRCYGSEVKKHGVFLIKILEGQHTCPRAMRNTLVTANWIAQRYLNVFRVRPEISVKELGRDIAERYAHDASKWKLYNAKEKAVEMLRGSVEDHYGKIRSYILELRRVDKTGRFELNVGIGSVFKALYIGFSALRKGFRMGCRKVIGLDGAFLKTYLGGVLLCAVGQDGNNQMFPIAWAAVQVENEVCWKWFLAILIEELEFSNWHHLY